MTTRFPGPIRRTPDLGERLLAARPDALTICKHVFFVLLAAGAAAYVVSFLYVTGSYRAGNTAEQPAFTSPDSFRQIAWVLGAIVGIVWRYRVWSKERSGPRQDSETGPAAKAEPPLKDRSEPRQDGETDRAAEAMAALKKAKEHAAREAALADSGKPSRAIGTLRRSPGAALGSAIRAAGAGSVFGFVAGIWVGMPLAIAVWSIALSPLVPAEWADFAMSVGSNEDVLAGIMLAVILGFAALGALLLFVLDLISGNTLEAGSKDGDTT